MIATDISEAALQARLAQLEWMITLSQQIADQHAQQTAPAGPRDGGKSINGATDGGRPQTGHQLENEPVTLAALEHVRDLLPAPSDHKTRRGVRPHRPFRRWVHLESGWQLLHVADEALLAVAPAAMVLARGAEILVQARRWFGAGDPRVQRVSTILERHADDTAEHHVRLSRADRYALVSVVHAIHTALDRSYAQARSFRNILILAFLLLLTAVAALILVGLAWPTSVPLCSVGNPAVGRLPICPTGRTNPTGGDVALVALIGTIAAGVSAVAAVSSLGSLIDPFHTPIWQGLLKIPIGAFTAVLGVLAVEEGLDAGAGIPTTQGGILFLAFVFGYSQQLFTRMVDARGSRIRAGLAGPTHAEGLRHPG